MFNETGGLHPKSRSGNGSAEDIHKARIAIAEVAKRLRESGHAEQVAPAEGGMYTGLWKGLAEGNRASVSSWNDSVSAARITLGGSNTTGSAMHYRFDSRDEVVPSWAKGRTPSISFGPFANSGGGDASSSPRLYVYR